VFLFFNKSVTNKKAGFTIIELLIVVVIAAILGGIVISNSASKRAAARDNERKAQLKRMQIALELYKGRVGSYPSTGGAWYSSEAGDNNNVTVRVGDYVPGLAPAYITKLPPDPKGGDSTISNCGGWKRAFLYRSDGTNYKLLSHCAPEGAVSSSDTFYDPARPNHAWAVSSSPATNNW
jgi:general secretion pathway protein G